MPVPIKTKRWDEKREADDGFRVLICRFRPRALKKADETWHAWVRDLGPSPELHAAIYGKSKDTAGRPTKVKPLDWSVYAAKYLAEIAASETAQDYIDQLSDMIAEGRTVTLLCSRSCTLEEYCHRGLLRRLLEARVAERLAAAVAEEDRP
jgi:uncharacterized protein YeaO (DUF488 family)